jgi:segregation and condensation protein B
MSLKAKVEAIIYAAEDPVTLEQMSLLLKDVVLADLASARENLALEQADSAAEAAAKAVEDEESELLPELAMDSAELICPETGPLMPEEASPTDVALPDTAPTEHPEEVSEPGVPYPSGEAGGWGTSSGDQPNPDAPEPVPNLDATSGQADAALGETAAAVNPAAAPEGPVPSESATVSASETTSRKRQPKKTEAEIAEDKAVRARVREVLVELVTDYANEDRGMEIRQVAGGFRMATKPEHHDVVRAFAKSLKPPIRLSLAALETLAVIAYKQPITGPEISDIRGVESASVLGTLLDRKLITTAGRKQVIGRPMQYKTSKDFLLRFGLNDVNELPSMEEFSQLASDGTIEITPTESQEAPSLFEPEASQSVPTAEPETGAPASNPRVPYPSGEAGGWGSPSTDQPAPEPAETETLETQDQGSSLPEPPEAVESQPAEPAKAADSQPQSESNNVPEAEHPSATK